MIKGQYEKITEKRPMIETFVLGTMLKHPGLFREYKIGEVDFIYDKTKFFFKLGRAMSKRHSSLDQASVLEFVNSNKDFKKLYDEQGGWQSIASAMKYANEKNIDVYIDNLAKNNLLVHFDKKNIDMISLIEENGVEFSPFRDLFPDMNCREVAEFYEGVISSGETASKNSNLNDYKTQGITLGAFLEKWIPQLNNNNICFEIFPLPNDKERGQIISCNDLLDKFEFL